MKSIRLALMLYFLVLLAVALGAVSWFVYQTTSETLLAKKNSTRNFLKAQYEGALDQRLLRQARILANLARFRVTHFESAYPVGLVGNLTLPNGYLNIPLWLEEGTYYPLAYRLYRSHPSEIRIEGGEDVIHPEEFFQTYNWRGQPLERYPFRGEVYFELELKKKDQDALLHGEFDELKLASGKEIRRVTLKVPMPGPSPRSNREPILPPLWRFPSFPQFKEYRERFSDWFKDDFPRAKTDLSRRFFFIQYGIDTAGAKKKLNANLQREEEETLQAMAGLKTRLLWISGLSFLALFLGGIALVRLGLKPLRKLSDAVSRVSEKDFRLPVAEESLPRELRPIASRLARTLDQLKRAFAREKQAAADISHELRTPLAALLTTLEVALRKRRTPEEYEEILQDCRAAGTQMTQLVERLLALARLDAGADNFRRREVDVAGLANQCADLVRPLAEAHELELRVHASGPANLQTDPDKLREILTNLLHNAIEYNRPQGKIDLCLERNNGTLCLEVRDTGIGIPPEAREHIFERFYRVDPSRQADTLHAGIGLAIVKGYVELLGGTISVESNSAGSTFRVQFPAQ